MTDRLWIFPAVLCVLISIAFLDGFNALGFVLCGLWLIRMFFLKQPLPLMLSLGVGMLFTGFLLWHTATNVTQLDAAESRFIFFPKATSIQVNGDQLRMEGVVQTGEAEEGVVLTYYFETEAEKDYWLNPPPMKHLLIKGELAEPAAHSNFYQFNYQKYLKRKNIHWQLRAGTLQPIAYSNLKNPSFHFIEQVRQTIFKTVNKVFHAKVASYIRTLFFADNRDFSEEALQQYRALGVVHLFSISGFHITYFAQIFRRFLLTMGVTHERTNLALVLFLPLYGLLAGFGVSVFRAVFQNMFQTLGRLRNRPVDTLDAWSLTLIGALCLNPYLVYHIAFQLSYLLSSIFILMGKQKWLSTLHPVWSSLIFSCLSFLGSLPILTVHFFEISWITVWANLLFIPFFTYFFFPMLLLLYLLSFFFSSTILFEYLQQLVAGFIETMEQFLSLINQTVDFTLVTGRLPAVVLLIFILSIFSVMKKVENRHTLSVLSVAGIFFSLFYYQIVPMGYVVMLDVGQGESIVIKDPVDKKVTVIDTGGQVQWGEREAWQIREDPFSIGSDQVVPALKALGVSEIDRLYITHADADHFGEMESIGQTLKIKEIAASRETLSHPSALQQFQALPQTKLAVLENSQAIDYPTKQTVALLPMEKTASKNNQSLVLYVNIGEDTWLFTGDIEKEAEQQMIRKYPNLQADYLKVAHHGSQTSSTTEFIQHIQPSEAWISAGRNNTFGHPNKEVLARLEENKIHVYSTSEQGALMKRYVKIPGFDYWFTDFHTVHTN